jgi:serpin B
MRNKLFHAGLALVLVGLMVLGCGPTPEPTPLPTEATGQEAMTAPDPARARAAALAYLAEAYGDQAPDQGLPWTEERTTPEGLVGSSSFEYTAGDWIVTVSFPVVAPDATIYTVGVSNAVTGFAWEGEVDANMQVMTPEEEATPAVDAPAASDAEVTELVDGNTAFAFDVYQALRAGDDNLFYSPYSISMALAMTYAGARGETERQMAETLRFLLSQSRLPPAFHALQVDLAQRAQTAGGEEDEGFQLNIANALWGQEGEPFRTSFLQVLDAAYGAGMRSLDFAAAPEQARITINDWVADQTEDKIQDLVPPGAIDALTRLVLTNAIYFNAAWANPFEPDATEDGAFTLLDGGQVTVPLMQQTASIPYAAGDGWQAVELMYQGFELSMVILLPQAGEFEAFESTLDAVQVDAILAELGYQSVALAMPRFEFESSWSLKETLVEMGMPAAFSGAADFSGMSDRSGLFIGDVIHKAFVSVDEAGTEAAAATAVIMPTSAGPQEAVEVRIDHPFLFLIRDIPTGAVLFVGRVINPEA